MKACFGMPTGRGCPGGVAAAHTPAGVLNDRRLISEIQLSHRDMPGIRHRAATNAQPRVPLLTCLPEKFHARFCLTSLHVESDHRCRRTHGGFALPAHAADTIKIGILHSLSGTMAISETVLKDTVLMAIDEINAKGGVMSKQLEPVIVDPASNWPLFAEKTKQLLGQDKVSVIFGCWTSVSRKSVLPVVEEMNGLLFYPAQYEREELSKNVFYTGAALNQQAIPAVDYLISKEGGGAGRWVLLGTNYVCPRTTNKILRAHLKTKGVKDADIDEKYTPFGHSDCQTIVADVKKFSQSGKTAVVSTINGDSNVPLYKELGNAGLKAKDVPVVAFCVGEEELRGVDTKPLVGRLVAWN